VRLLLQFLLMHVKKAALHHQKAELQIALLHLKKQQGRILMI
jgi:hypothetical protein